MLPRFDGRPLARVGQDSVVRLLGVRGCSLERLPKHESRIFSTPGLALPAQGEGQHGVSELGQKMSAVLDRRAPFMPGSEPSAVKPRQRRSTRSEKPHTAKLKPRTRSRASVHARSLLAAFFTCLASRYAGHCLYAEKRTEGFDTIRSNPLRENPRLSDDGIRGNPPLHYDDASDAGVGAKSVSGARSQLFY